MGTSVDSFIGECVCMRVSVCVGVWVCGCQNMFVRVLANVCAIVGACVCGSMCVSMVACV